MAAMPRGVLLFARALVTFWAVFHLALALHELGHGLAAWADHREVRGIVVTLNFLERSGAYVERPYVEHTGTSVPFLAGGPAAHVALGVVALVLGRLRPLRRALALPTTVMVCLGGSAMVALTYAITGTESLLRDIVLMVDAAGGSSAGTRWIAGAIGAPAAIAVGVWYLFAILRWGERYVGGAGGVGRRGLLVSVAWGPVAVLLAVQVVGALTTGGALTAAVLAAVAVACLAAVRVFAEIAPERNQSETGASVSPASLVPAVLLAVAVFGLVSWVNARFDPLRVPTRDEVARDVARAPESERVLRWAGYRSLEQRRVDEAVAYYSRAVAVAPESPGALHDLGMALLAGGEPETALDLLVRARDLAPGIPGILSKTAQVQETLGRNEDAARTWREYADRVEAEWEGTDSAARHARMARGRARHLEAAADRERLDAASP